MNYFRYILIALLISITHYKSNAFVSSRIARQGFNAASSSILNQLIPEFGKPIIDLIRRPAQTVKTTGVTIERRSSIKEDPYVQFATRVEFFLKNPPQPSEIQRLSFQEQDFLLSHLLNKFFDPHDSTHYAQMYPLMIACDKMDTDILKMLEKHTAEPSAFYWMNDLKSLPADKLPKKVREQREHIKQKVNQQGKFRTFSMINSKL